MRRKLIILILSISILLLCIVLLLTTVYNNYSSGIKKKQIVRGADIYMKQQLYKFPGIDDVETAAIVTRYTALSNKYYYFDLSKVEQKNKIVNILDWLNLNSESIAPNIKEVKKSNGGLLYTFLIINFKNGKSINIYFNEDMQADKKIIIQGTLLNESVVTEKCPQLVQFLSNDWKSLSGVMKQEIH